MLLFILFLFAIQLVSRSQGIRPRRHTDATNPFIIDHPEDQYVLRNEPATLNCKVEGDPLPIITWYHDGRPVVTANEDPDSHRMLLPSGQLFFLKIIHTRNSRPDVGTYYCNATNPETGFSVLSRNATLDIAVIQTEFRESPAFVTDVALGQETVLRCRPPKGDPEPRVRWRKDGAALRTAAARGESSASRVYVDETGSLYVTDVRKEDAGKYVCVASNIAGERESSPALLTVRERPRIIDGPRDTVAQENTDVHFQCIVSGDPEPAVIWRKVDGLISPDRSSIVEDRQLKIMKVQSSDEGVYVCRTENGHGSQEVEARLTVHSPPSFVVTPQDMVVGVGRHVSFYCDVIGNPIAAVFWSRRSSQTFMFPNQDHGRFTVMEDGTLRIRQVEMDDSDEYTCQGLSMAGSAYAKASLQVLAEDTRLPPIIVHGPQNQTLPVSGLATLGCTVTGEPRPTVHWYRNGRAIPRREARFTVVDSSLQIADLRRTDSGLYTCRASSETGDTSWNATLVVEVPTNPSIIFRRATQLSTVPGPPPRPLVTDPTPETLRLTWRPNANVGASPVSGYNVEMFSPEFAHKGWVVVGESVREPTLTVRGLRTGTTYLFLVRALNSHGISPPSQPTTSARTTGELNNNNSDLPSDMESRLLTSSSAAALPLTAQPLSSTAVKLNWQLQTRMPASTTIPLPPLEGFYIKYRAVTSEHDSHDDSTSRRHVIGSDSGMGGAYEIDTLRSPSATQHVISGLRPYTLYEVIVQPFFQSNLTSGIGTGSGIAIEGVASGSRRVRTFEDVPTGAPTDIEGHLINNSTLFLEWKAPPTDRHNGPLLGYKIYLYGSPMTTTSFNNASRRMIRELRVNASLQALYIYQLDSTTSGALTFSGAAGSGVRGESNVAGGGGGSIAPQISYSVQMAAYNRVGEGVRSRLIPIGGVEEDEVVSEKDLSSEPWFVAVLVGMVGAFVWVILCAFSVYVVRKHRCSKRRVQRNNGCTAVPVHKLQGQERFCDIITRKSSSMGVRPVTTASSHYVQPINCSRLNSASSHPLGSSAAPNAGAMNASGASGANHVHFSSLAATGVLARGGGYEAGKTGPLVREARGYEAGEESEADYRLDSIDSSPGQHTYNILESPIRCGMEQSLNPSGGLPPDLGHNQQRLSLPPIPGSYAGSTAHGAAAAGMGGEFLPPSSLGGSAVNGNHGNGCGSVTPDCLFRPIPPRQLRLCTVTQIEPTEIYGYPSLVAENPMSVPDVASPAPQDKLHPHISIPRGATSEQKYTRAPAGGSGAGTVAQDVRLLPGELKKTQNTGMVTRPRDNDYTTEPIKDRVLDRRKKRDWTLSFPRDSWTLGRNFAGSNFKPENYAINATQSKWHQQPRIDTGDLCETPQGSSFATWTSTDGDEDDGTRGGLGSSVLSSGASSPVGEGSTGCLDKDADDSVFAAEPAPQTSLSDQRHEQLLPNESSCTANIKKFEDLREKNIPRTHTKSSVV